METNKWRSGIIIPMFLLILSGCAMPLESASNRQSVVVYENPAWAPAYHPGVRYYYFPDLEMYYDLSNRDFIYLSDGQWLFSNTLPPFYADYNLYNGFVVSLNVRVFQPWRHHQYYVSNYPRYYYRNFYSRETHRVRGFSENERHPIYYQNDNGRRSDGNNRGSNYGVGRDDHRTSTYNRDNEGGRTNGVQNNNQNNQNNQNEGRSSRYDTPTPSTPQTTGRSTRFDNPTPSAPQPSGRSESVTPPTPPTPKETGGRSSTYTRQPQEPNYYGKKIGQPVKVERQMREQKENKKENNKENKTNDGRR